MRFKRKSKSNQEVVDSPYSMEDAMSDKAPSAGESEPRPPACRILWIILIVIGIIIIIIMLAFIAAGVYSCVTGVSDIYDEGRKLATHGNRILDKIKILLKRFGESKDEIDNMKEQIQNNVTSAQNNGKDPFAL